MPVQVITWNHPEPPDPDALLARLQRTGRSYYVWGNEPGDTYAVHTHAYRKHLVCLTGSIRFTLPTTSEVVDLHAGDELDLPAGTAHGAIVGDSGVRCAEAHMGG